MRFLFLFLVNLSFLSAATTAEHATVYFSPDDQVADRLIRYIDLEKESIYIAVYNLTHRGVANALIHAKQRGVEVEVIVDRFALKKNSPLDKMVKADITVHVWDPTTSKHKNAHRPLMHNKFCLFGKKSVWTGSFNFTYEASRLHQENVVVLEDPSLVQAFKNQFYNIKMRSCTPYASYVAYDRPRKH